MKKEQLCSRRTAKLALLLALVFTFVPSLHAQEYTKQVLYENSSGSIIREYKEDTNIVYNVSDDFNGFLMVTEAGTMVPVLKIKEDSYVNDFEIYNDTVYFCGQSYDALNMRFIGFTGYFGLSAFPTTAIRAYYLPKFKNLTRMELLHSAYGGPMHIAMVGKTEEGFPTIADAIVMSPSTWNFYYSTGDGVDKVYDDVAVTSSHVLAAVRNTMDKSGEIYYFDHPLPGYTFLYGTAFKVSMDTNILSNIILEARDEDQFSSVCNIQDGELSQMIDVVNYSGMSNIHNHVIIEARTHTPRDLKYNPDEQKLDVLTNTMYYSIAYSEIFHVNSSNIVDGHQYIDHHIRSLSYLNTSPYHFIASGFSDEGQYLYIYRYLPSNVMKCPDIVRPRYSTMKIDKVLIPFGLHVNTLDGLLSHVLQGIGEDTLKTRCLVDPRLNNNNDQ